MFKARKHLIIILVFIILASLFTSQYTYANQNDETKDTPEKSKVKTVKAHIGEYIERSSLKNMELRALKYDEFSIVEREGSFVEFLVNQGQGVKKDQPLASYTVPVDELVLEEKQMIFRKNEENFRKASEQKELDIAENLSRLMTMNGASIEAQILKLNIQKMQASYEQFIYQTQRNLDKQRKELEELEANKELKYVKAPFDGIVWFNNWMEKGTLLDPGSRLITMADINSAVLVAESAGAANMWYNLEVTINPINNRQENTDKSFKGKVVAIDTLLNGEATTGKIYIKPESITEEMASPGQRANILANAIDVKNVLIIPSAAVKVDKGLKYVYILDSNGQVRKQYISGRDNGSDTWVFNGLSEGQEIVIE